ncbi:M42 family metallopeptidase [Crassaminicella thermophila]|uniref:M42 family metallopeptidase n=1 Tax=Crassaminicella thermophila TaxID=2599308 RepID=A0A5C0SFR1_CRATE|nr:M42 family metallopeptidase [Crassaminicella thermophila]QEK13181.1 M42 family metallopeptidase [Crassaminicella thermophila]
MNNQYSLLKKLTEAFGPSGNEETITAIIQDEIKNYVDEIKVDKMGNLIAIKKGTGAKVMIASHMDEIGIIVTGIDDNGFLRFANIGGVSPYISLGQRVQFANGTIGIVGMQHLDDIKKLKLEKMYIDIGAKDKQEAMNKVSIGDVACFYRSFTSLDNYITAKALDDRIGCYVAIETIKNIKNSPNELYFVFTVQEELGARGAKTASFGINPDLGIAVDVTATGDTPKSKHMAVKLDEGPAIKIKDHSLLAHPTVKNLMIDAAKNNQIPYQLEILEFGGTDSGTIHTTRAGVPSGVLSIPCRYIHSPSEMVSKKDVENAILLLTKILEKDIIL